MGSGEDTMQNEIKNWKPNANAPLWYGENEQFFSDLRFNHKKQIGPSCVPTSISMVLQAFGHDVSIDDVKKEINTQAPHSWSAFLQSYGLQLAYCNTDQRPLGLYIDELIEMDDLFFLSFYSHEFPSVYDGEGKFCTAHIITLNKSTIYDTAVWNGVCHATQYHRLGNRVKRIFRIVPLGYERCI